METISTTTDQGGFDFDTARKVTGGLAKSYNPGASLMACYDKKQIRHSPSEVECNVEGLAGWEEYGWHHGGKKRWCSVTGIIFSFIHSRFES